MSSNDHPQDSNVLSLKAHTNRVQQIETIETYWNEVRGNRLVPSRCEIDPRGLTGALSNAFILERIAGGLARFRIAGAHLSDLTGLELRQMPISALFMPASREVLSEALRSAFEDPAIIRMNVMSPGGFGRQPLAGEMILLPLRSDLGDVDRILGGLVFEGQIGRTPRRIEIVSQSRRTLVGYAGPRHAERDPLPSSRTFDDASRELHAQSSIGEGPAPINDRSHLKLIVSND